MATVGVNGTQLYYEETGQGQPILFIHGMCGDASVWADQARRLSPHFRCVAYDRRGHSRSPLGEHVQRSVELHADDAAQLVEALGLAPCVLVGSSGGARIGVDVVRRYPHLIRCAVLSEPPITALAPDGGRMFLQLVKPAVETAMAQGGPRAAVDAFFEIMCPGLWAGLRDDQRNMPYGANAAELIGDLMMPPYQVTRGDLAQIRRPCRIIRGSESNPSLRQIAGIVADSIPGADLIEMQGSGHVTYFERPVEFAFAVDSFLKAEAAS